MITQAHSPHTEPRPPTGTTSSADGTTQPLDPAAEAIVTAPARLLDHRTRRRAVRRRGARAGDYLVIEEADGEALLLPLQAPVTHVGRAATADLRIEERRISRHHAIVVRHGRSARLLDNRSANGTWLNGRPIVAANLSDGDVIRLGPVVLQFLALR